MRLYSLNKNIFICIFARKVLYLYGKLFSSTKNCLPAKDVTRITRKKVRDFSTFSGELFKRDICTVDWNRFFHSGLNNIDKKFSTFYKTLNKIVNKQAQIKSLSKRLEKRQAKPWITEGIRTSIKLKKNLCLWW